VFNPFVLAADKNGKHNNPRPFSGPELAEKGIVSYQNTTTNVAYTYISKG